MVRYFFIGKQNELNGIKGAQSIQTKELYG